MGLTYNTSYYPDRQFEHHHTLFIILPAHFFLGVTYFVLGGAFLVGDDVQHFILSTSSPVIHYSLPVIFFGFFFFGRRWRITLHIIKTDNLNIVLPSLPTLFLALPLNDPPPLPPNLLLLCKFCVHRVHILCAQCMC